MRPKIPVSRPSLGHAELEAVRAVFETGWLGLGSVTYEFEQALKEYLGAEHVVAVNTGTSALHLALEGLYLDPGDEVIVPSLTFAASVQAIIAAGATPVFCDVLEDTLLMDVEDVARRLTPRTRAVMPVHYCGNPCDMDALLTLAERHLLMIVEDAAHAFGSMYDQRMVGGLSHERDITCFSFDPIKIITCGEGGAIVTHDPGLAEELRRMRLLGIDKDTWHRYRDRRSWFYEVTTPGYRYHMGNLNAAMGLAQLRKVDRVIARRREICRRYDEAFFNLSGVDPLPVDYDTVVPFMYVVKIPNGRDAFMSFLRERGIGTGVHYIPNHLHPHFQRYVRDGGRSLPQTNRTWLQIVTLPLYPTMTHFETKAVIDAVTAFAEQEVP